VMYHPTTIKKCHPPARPGDLPFMIQSEDSPVKPWNDISEARGMTFVYSGMATGKMLYTPPNLRYLHIATTRACPV